MKQLLFIMALVCVMANAQSNPFALQENLQKIDKDQDVLLSALREMADKKEFEVTTTEESIKPSGVVEELMAEKKAQEEQSRNEQAKVEEERIAKQEAEQKELEKQKIAKLAAQKREEERLEVEAYEAKKIAKKQVESIVDINITHEQKLSKKEADRAYLEAIQEMQ